MAKTQSDKAAEAVARFGTTDIPDPDALWSWLASGPTEGTLLVLRRKGRLGYVSEDQLLDALIAHGWIDGRRWVHPTDETLTLRLATPRAQQAWSQSYKDRAERLEAEGRMAPAGRAAIEEGRASGLWDFYADVDALVVPPDLSTALGPLVGDWDLLPSSYRRNLLRWVKLAKTEPTRAKRIASIHESLRTGRRIPQM